MRLATKLLLATCIPPFLIMGMGLYFGNIAEENLDSVLKKSASGKVRALYDEIDRLMLNRAANWQAYARSLLVQDTLKQSNQEFATFTNLEEVLSSREKNWGNAGDETAVALAIEIMSNRLSEDLKRTLEKLNEISGYPVFGEIFVTNEFGANVSQTQQTSDYLQGDEEWWTEAMENGLYFGDIKFDDSTESYSVEICVRIDDTDGEMLGVLKAVMSIDGIYHIIMAHEQNLGSETSLDLLLKDGRAIAPSGGDERPGLGQPDRDYTHDGDANWQSVSDDDPASARGVTFVIFKDQNGRDLMTYRAEAQSGDVTSGLGWVVYQQMSGEALFAPIRQLRRAAMTVSVLVGLLGLLIVGSLALPLSRRIGRLEDATKAIAAGKLDTPIESEAKDELGSLTRAFDEMRLSLKKGGETLESERRLLHAMMEHLPDHIYFKDADSRFIMVSRALARHFGFDSPEEAIGKNDRDFFTEEHAAAALEDEKLLMLTGEPMVGKEEEETWTDRPSTWVSTTKMPLRNERGKVIGTFGISSNITSRKHAEVAMGEAKLAAEEANRAKSDFLANMSHEIRTPMNGIIGMTELLLHTKLNDEQHEYAMLSYRSADSLLDLINDILDFSKIEAGKLELDAQEFDLRDSIGDTLQTLAVRATQKKIEVAYQIPPEVPDRLIGDLGRLRQILVNLVGNAIKFTEEGEVVVTLSVADRSEETVTLRFSVMDTGIGVPGPKQKVIFEAFSQADSSTARRFGGTGLGLAISSQLVSLMNGELTVESDPGEGSTFSFTADFGIGASQGTESLAPPESLMGLPVLIVDDNQTNRRILEEMLSNWELSPTAVDGAEAALVAMEEACSENRRFQLVLLDYMMPEVDGLELAKQIGHRPEFGRPRLILLSSAGRPNTGVDTESLDVSRFLNKPVKQSDLLDSITDAMGIATRDRGAARSAPALFRSDQPSMEVLLAEDGRVNQIVAMNLLEGRGHRVTLAADGREAVEVFSSKPFDAILMDIQMPELNGLEATRAIRKIEAERGGHVPIIAMTANAMKGDRENCLASGMDDYIAKPVHSEELFRILEGYSQAEATTDSDPQTPASGDGAEISGFDPELFRSAMRDERLMSELIDIYREDTPAMIESIAEHLESGDLKALHNASHALKGQLGNYSAKHAYAVAVEFDDAIRVGNLDGARRLHPKLLATLRCLGDCLDALQADLSG